LTDKSALAFVERIQFQPGDMVDTISTARRHIDDQLEALQSLLTDEPVDVVTERYQAWKARARAALLDLVVESVVGRFDLARGQAVRREGHRPTPPVYLDGAASRAFLVALKKEIEVNPAAALLVPPSEAIPDPMDGLGKIMDLLERRLPKAFRGRPETEGDLRRGFETLLAGADIAYEREGPTILHASRTYVPDFTFPLLQTALALKLCERPDRERGIVAEIHDEILAYRPRYRVVFGVCDLGFIRDPEGFVRAFEKPDGVLVRVMKIS